MLLVQGPKLLLLDEPGRHEPPGAPRHVRCSTSWRGSTVVVIEHDMAFLRRFAHTVTVLSEGRLLFEGTVEEVQADPDVRRVYLGRSRDQRRARPRSRGVECREPGNQRSASPTGAPRWCSASP